MTFKQEERLPTDGPVEVTREGWGIVLTVENKGEYSSIKLSPYNAARMFGLLSVILGIRLPKNISKSISM